jgi:methionine salvage enolase-phosphatase E1
VTPLQRQMEMEQIRERSDEIMQASKKVRYLPESDETPDQYRMRLIHSLKSETPLKNLKASASASGENLDKLEAKIYADAWATARNAPDLRAIIRIDATGREITEFVGAKRAWMSAYQAPGILSAVHVNGRPCRIP